ncbi:MAG: D-Ala-D-Ala carboxypeptidase family metallohydrolase [Candidatus Zixiibacteriota bacterium]
MNGELREAFRRIRLGFPVFAALSLTCSFWPGSAAPAFNPEKAGFWVKFKEENSSYRVMGIYLLPGEKLTLEAGGSENGGPYLLEATTGNFSQIKKGTWQWQAPQQPGLYPLKLIDSSSADSMILNLFVMVPASEVIGEYLRGYRIGKYPSIPYKQLPLYKRPKGFVEVSEENAETLLSPHFKLKQFVCKQEGGYPKYVVLRERLLLKLELILENTNQRGYRCETFEILSGYRTPYYNKTIGNVKYSRHVYGDAADIFIDEDPVDGMMDDLNRDGKMDYKDAGVIYDIIDEMYGRPWYERFLGGLGRYKKTSNHGPFVHVDARGFRARWGD